MTGNKSIFRPEVLQAKKNDILGATISVRKYWGQYYFFFAFTALALLVLLICFGEYQEQIRISGFLAPQGGVVRVSAPKSGVIVERLVEEGQKVSSGQPLFSFSDTTSFYDVNEKLPVSSAKKSLEIIAKKLDFLKAEENHYTENFKQKMVRFSKTISSFEEENEKISEEIHAQNSRLESGRELYKKYSEMREQGFLSALALQQKKDDIYEGEARVKSLERQRIVITRNSHAALSESENLKEEAKVQLSQYLQKKILLEEQKIKILSNQLFYVLSPKSGVVTAIISIPGQVASGQTMLSILPEKVALEAVVFLPVNLAGTVEVGQAANITYEAFPYQRYGKAFGKIIEKSKTTVSADDFQELSEVEGKNNKLFYRIRIMLASQVVEFGHEKHELQSGMSLHAEISLRKRSILDIIAEPFKVARK
jgi:membrane fusion protein